MIDILRREDRDIVVIFVLGGPGVGKGTQCTSAAQEFDFVHISAGELLREEANSVDSPYRDFIKTSFLNSIPVPPEITIDLLEKRINAERERGQRKFLLDGFPRSVEQAVEFERRIHDRNFILLFTCSVEAMKQRLAQRAKSSGRIDDDPETIAKRLKTFEEMNQSVMNHLRESSSVSLIDCNHSVPEVYALVKKAIREILQQ